jgi:Transposase IS116/IS110/IS902 family
MLGTLDQTLQPAQLEPFTKLDKDLKTAATTLTAHEARFLVDSYYSIQGYRIRFGNQIRAMSESGEPHELTRWMYANVEGLESNVKKALDTYSKAQTVGQWARSIPGIGPVIASGLLAHIDITKAPTSGHIWSFAGLAVGQVWEKGQKRPWNADLKKLCYLLGESFVKVQNRPNDIYGHVFADRKKLEQEANGYLFYAEQAADTLKARRIGKDTDAYKAYAQGILPPAHIHARARRYAVKLFLAHLHDVWYEVHYKEKPPRPYIIEHLGHVHFISPPNWPMKDSEQEPAQADEIIEATPDMWPERTSETIEIPRKTLYLTLELQLLQFKEAIEQVEQHALPSGIILAPSLTETSAGFRPTTYLADTGETSIPPQLAERLARFRAQQERIISKQAKTKE